MLRCEPGSRDYDDWLNTLQTNGGKPLTVPKGSAAPINSRAGGSANPPAACVASRAGRPLCASLGPAGALRHAGFQEQADFLETRAEDVLAATTNGAAEAVRLLCEAGGWNMTRRLRNFNPLIDRSALPTIVQLCERAWNGGCRCGLVATTPRLLILPLMPSGATRTTATAT